MIATSPLIGPDELRALLDADGRAPRIVDLRWYLGKPGRGRAAYDEGHLPGAIHLDLDADLSARTGPGRHPLPEPAALAARLGSAGIGDDDLVVAYDDVGGWVAARLWWMLDTLGHAAIAVLDGGLQGWVASGGSLTTDVPHWPPTTLRLGDAWTGTIDRIALRARLGDLVLLDARAGPRYRGEVEPVDALPGHIPTALNAPTDGNLAANGRFLSPDALRDRFGAMGADGSGGEVVTSCGSGTSACHISLAMRVAGLPDPILYPGSYSDWTRAGEPVATGPEPGKPPTG